MTPPKSELMQNFDVAKICRDPDYFCHMAYFKVVKGVLQRTFFISTNERLMYKFYKNCNYFIFK